MAALALKSLIERLDPKSRAALEASAGLTLSRSHYNVELEHWFLKLLDGQGHDIALILHHYDIDEGRLAADLNRGLDRLKTAARLRWHPRLSA
jgi:type VI secretion system protein VasG